MNAQSFLLVGAALAIIAAAPAAQAVTISNGVFTVGIGPDGELYDPGSGIGFRRNSDGFDPLARGIPRDSWGLAWRDAASGALLGSAYADQSLFGSVGIAGPSVTHAVPSAAGVTTPLQGGLVLGQIYQFAAPLNIVGTPASNIIRIAEYVENTLAVPISITIQRDWDVDFATTTYPNNDNTRGGPGGKYLIIDSSYDGFEDPDPSTPYNFSCFAGCNVDGDTGGGIKYALGTINKWFLKTIQPGEVATVDYYYGVNLPGQTVDQLISQAHVLGLDYGIATQSLNNGENSAFIGIGVNNIPEPATWALMLTGFGLAGLALRGSRGPQRLPRGSST